MENKIIAICTEAGLINSLKEALSAYRFEAFGTVEAASQSFAQELPNLILIDYDLKEGDGLQSFRQLQKISPRTNVIMLATEHNIPLAVAATKSGVADFLHKPLATKQLLAAVEKNLTSYGEIFLPPAEPVWLSGEGPVLVKLYKDLKQALIANQNILLTGERGINKLDVVRFIHEHGLKRQRNLKIVDLHNFSRPEQEALFWTSLQEIMANSAQIEEERCGTLFLDNLEAVEKNFRLSVLEFFRQKKENVDQTIMVIIGLYDKVSDERFPQGFGLIDLPPLRLRKDDLPLLAAKLMEQLASKHNKKVRGLTRQALTYLMLFDYPGNYQELANILDQAVLAAAGEMVELKDLPLDQQWLLSATAKQALKSGKISLKVGRREFEKELYSILLAKADGDIALLSRYLDIPRHNLQERIEALGSSPLD
ncbi:hypothetical protein A2311_00165 [candidate division WOR-1 bacterium RIFOXYB2_FULL_48_7]|uniref:Response regulatory domain-containing protein n=1 Tax=candidate division WOR-1 bacterium RIFOXYB2_FULL_48_7 TaxID=1802583 RepID=A0A1F4TUE5_UNCSA|nr:MAG: hypothetical protein A2311_00165 [candidate division WOR-1 bacterium RIFOXYB2_FULL_48_7]